MINMIMHHLRIRNNTANKVKFFIGLVIITILCILRSYFGMESRYWFKKFGANKNDTTIEETWLLFWVAAVVFGLILLCLLFSVRKSVMKDRKIYYSFWENCCMVFWCHCCVICQSANEYAGDDGKEFWKVEIV